MKWSKKMRSGVLATGVVILSLLVVIVVTSDDPSGTGVEVVRVLLGWPAVAGALLAGFAVVFRDELSQFLRNMSRVRLPGGTELESQPGPAEIDEASIPDEAAPTPTPSQGMSQDQFIRDVIGITMQKHRDSLYWFYMFLNHFLVQTTKEVLMWIGSTPGIMRDIYDEVWQPRMPEPIQRILTLNALLQTNLVEESGGMLHITDLGRRYLLFLEGRMDEALIGPGPPPST